MLLALFFWTKNYRDWHTRFYKAPLNIVRLKPIHWVNSKNLHLDRLSYYSHVIFPNFRLSTLNFVTAFDSQFVFLEKKIGFSDETNEFAVRIHTRFSLCPNFLFINWLKVDFNVYFLLKWFRLFVCSVSLIHFIIFYNNIIKMNWFQWKMLWFFDKLISARVSTILQCLIHPKMLSPGKM